MNKKILELKNVSKTYKTKAEEIHVLKNINLTFNSGDFVSIQGKSGSGKTSLLNILGLLDVPTSGDVFIDEKKVNMKDEKLKNILDGKVIASIGPVTTKTIEKYGIKVNIEAEKYTEDGLLNAIEKYYKN